MGEYLYGLRKLPKRKLVNTTTGPSVVEYVLEFKCKPYYTGIFGSRMDKHSQSIMDRLVKKGTVQAVIQYGKNIYKWNAAAYWFDSADIAHKAQFVGTVVDHLAE